MSMQSAREARVAPGVGAHGTKVGARAPPKVGVVRVGGRVALWGGAGGVGREPKAAAFVVEPLASAACG